MTPLHGRARTGRRKRSPSSDDNRRKVVKESFIALSVTIFTSIIAGVFLGHTRELLVFVPGLIAIIPGSLAMRGNIFGAMGSRLSSSFHLGSIHHFSFKNEIIRENIFATLFLSLFLSLVLGSAVWITGWIIGIQLIPLQQLVSISVFSGILSGMILLVMTFMIAFASYSRGWDPDNIMAPLITAIGDLVTVPILIGVTLLLALYVHISWEITIGSALLVIVVLAYMAKRHVIRGLIAQSVGVLSVTVLISVASGLFLQHQIIRLAALPAILILLPAFLEEGGNVGNILASRLSTRIHLGLVHKNDVWNSETRRELGYAVSNAIFVFPLVAVASWAFARIAHIPLELSLWNLFVVSIVAGFILVILVTLITLFFSTRQYARVVDPDNVLIPIVTTLADLLGVLLLMGVLLFLGFLV